jgi:hypothetical protein
LRVIAAWIILGNEFQEDQMGLRLILAGLIAVSLAGTAAAGAPKHPKRHRATAPAVRVVPNNPCADPYAVCWAGNYIGRDPDPNVRSQLLWDFQAGLPND